MSTSAPLHNDMLYALAPVKLASYRNERFSGDSISVKLDEFAQLDQQHIVYLYTTLLDLQTVFDTNQSQFDNLIKALNTFAKALNPPMFVHTIQQLGNATARTTVSPALSRVIHDIRGGGLVAAMMALQLLLLSIDPSDTAVRLNYLVRDHLAMMRNCIPDLDRTHREGQQQHAKAITMIEQTWDGSLYSLPEATARITLDSRFSGRLATSDTEFAALRRTLYNLINNAVRYNTDGTVYLSIFGLPNKTAQDARFVVYNRITSEHQQALQQRYAHNLSDLFRGGFTTSGSGLGMRICAEFIAEDYGVGIDHCITDGYVGAKLLNGYFVAWFHWPAVAQREVGRS